MGDICLYAIIAHFLRYKNGIVLTEEIIPTLTRYLLRYLGKASEICFLFPNAQPKQTNK